MKVGLKHGMAAGVVRRSTGHAPKEIALTALARDGHSLNTVVKVSKRPDRSRKRLIFPHLSYSHFFTLVR